MGDNLEDFMKSHEEGFDLSEPKDGHFDRFEAKLGAEKKKATFDWGNLLKVAAVIVFVIGSGVLLVNDNSSTVNASDGLGLKDISPELAEVESFYLDQIDNATEELEPVKELDPKGYSKNLTTQLTLLEEDYNDLKLELKENYGDERLITSMITNYQLRLQIIEQYLIQIKANHIQNPEDNEHIKY